MGNGDKNIGNNNVNGKDISGPSFASLVLSISSSAWIGLGKIIDPITGKLKVDLDGAKYSIDTLIMLREKTKGNLTEDEQKLLNGVIADLQANYAETVFSYGKDKETSEKSEKEERAEGTAVKKEPDDESVKNEVKDKLSKSGGEGKKEADESVKRNAGHKQSSEKGK